MSYYLLNMCKLQTLLSKTIKSNLLLIEGFFACRVWGLLISKMISKPNQRLQIFVTQGSLKISLTVGLCKLSTTKILSMSLRASGVISCVSL
jgi:hypothetical protein